MASQNPETPSSSSEGTPTPPPACPVVGIGGSAGGLEALQKFFAALPAGSGLAFVVVQHLDPHHESALPELLAKVAPLPVEQARDGTAVRPEHVYVIAPNSVLTVGGGVLRTTAPSPTGLRMPIDSLFHSLAEDQRDNAVCILLSGSGSDGTLGLRSVKEHGGMVMAQSPESAKHDHLLRSAIATGLVDHVLPPAALPAKLLEYGAYLKEVRARQGTNLADDASAHLGRIAALLRRRTGHDFSRYKAPTLVRRIQRRMHVLQVAHAAAYLEILRQEPKEMELLFRDLLIGVTHFFRDPEAFAVLEREVIPLIVEAAGAEGSIRVWTPGCATGEEAYSIAILLREASSRRDVQPRVQIFAGDIDEEALDGARHGRYPEGIAEHITPERLERFFTRENHSYLVSKELREMCVFSTHNLIRDPPFSRLDLIVCRNLLIYLEADLQRHIATVFHYALRPGGFLFLGPSESIAGPPDLFRTVDKKFRIFQRNETVTRPPLSMPHVDRPLPTRAHQRTWTPRVPAPGQPEMISGLERLLLDHYAPAWVIVNAQGESIYFSPRTGRFLEPPAGAPTMDVLDMARKGLRLDLRTALHRAMSSGQPVVHENVAVEADGHVQRVNLVVRPLKEAGGDDSALFMVVFQETGPPTSREAEAQESPPAGGEHLVQQLESELRMTKEHLQATVEEVETSNEELKSSNEELLSTNEELQSANEELQTSKEELQSVNEELETINAELNKKVEELDRANSDLQNLLQSTRIPTLFLDNHLRIKRFTEAATIMFRLIETDVGRPITDIAARFEGEMVPLMKEVLRTLSACERQVRLVENSATYLMRILPYRRVDNVIDGLVITFLDITQLEDAQAQRAQLAAIVENSHDPIVGRDMAGDITTWNRAAARMLGYSERDMVGRPLASIVPPERRNELALAFLRLKEGAMPSPFVSAVSTKDGRRLDVSVVISPINDSAGRLVGGSAILRDITEVKQAGEALKEEGRHKDEFLALLSHELRNPLAPIRSALDVIRLADQSPEQLDSSLRMMDRQVAQLTSLVDQLMDASRIANGKIRLDLQDEELVELVRSTVEDQRPIVEAAGLSLEAELPDRDYWVHGDRLRLAQVITNLLGNAVKFTERGGTVTVELHAEGGQAVIAVRDTGIGIEPHLLKGLFLPFSQVDNHLQRARGGLGLGLALVRTLVAAHGGSVEAMSEGPGRGAEFAVRLPLQQDRVRRRSQETSDRLSRKPIRPRRVLVVEDNLDAAEGMRTLLEVLGHSVVVAHDGSKAIGLALGDRFDLVLCDLGLPGMTGYEVAAALRAAGEVSFQLVALTGYDQPGDQARTRDAGFDRHLTKPVDVATIRRLLEELPER